MHRAGVSLRGLIRILLFKRFESSVEAFRKSIERLIRTHEAFLKALDEGFVPAGEEAETLLGKGASWDDQDFLDALAKVSGKYDIKGFDIELLRKHIQADHDLLIKILEIVDPITPERDDKLQTFLKRLAKTPIKGNKCLIFTQYADTAIYLYKNINPEDKKKDIDFIYGTEKSKSRVVGRFAPKANPEFVFQKGDTEIRLLVATDVLAEGLNMQDCNVVLNYDLHWNPVRLIQRFGRIDRIGSEHDVIYGLNFLPETGLEKNLGLKAILDFRIQEIHDTIGEDAAILDSAERLNEEAMYAIYEMKSGQLDLFDEDCKSELIDLNEAEEIIRSLAKDDPDEFERIKNLRDGIRSAKPLPGGSFYLFGQAGNYKQLMMIDSDGKHISRDMPKILGAIKASINVKAPTKLPENYNKNVMKLKKIFSEEVKDRKARKEHTVSLNQAQKYVLQELRVLYSITDDEDMRGRINILERAFRMTPTVPVAKELNFLKRNSVTGEILLKSLTEIYHQNRLAERVEQQSLKDEAKEIPRVICSEADMEG